MKADHNLLMKAAELGILRSLPDYLDKPLELGRLRRRFEEIGLIVNGNLRQIYNNNPNFFSDNAMECAAYLEKFGSISGLKSDVKKEDIHVTTMVNFCLFFLKESESKYPESLCVHLQDILDYYGKVLVSYNPWMGKNFKEEWEKLKNG